MVSLKLTENVKKINYDKQVLRKSMWTPTISWAFLVTAVTIC